MKNFLLSVLVFVFSGSATAHAGLYHTLVERPLSIWPAVAVTLAFILVVYVLEEIRKKKKVREKFSELFS